MEGMEEEIRKKGNRGGREKTNMGWDGYREEKGKGGRGGKRMRGATAPQTSIPGTVPPQCFARRRADVM